MTEIEKRMFEIFIGWCKSETKNSNSEWVWGGDFVYQDGVDVTADYYNWMQIKLSKGDTNWMKH